MTREHNTYLCNLHELDLNELMELCANVARNRSADEKQSDMAHALRVEWVRLRVGSLKGDKQQAED